MHAFSARNSAGSTGHAVWVFGALVMTLAAVMFISTQPQGGNDFWLQAKVGELIVQQHRIPPTLLFPFTEAQDLKFNAHGWLPSILFHGLVVATSTGGLALVLGFGGLLLFAMVARLAWRRSGGNVPLAFLLGLMAVGVENYRHTLRPELFSLLFLAAFLYCMELCRVGRSRLAQAGALLIVAVWANTHGSFILAPAIAFIFGLGALMDRWRFRDEPRPAAGRYFVLALLSLACAAVNPEGFHLIRFVVGFGSSNIQMYEWLPSYHPDVMQQRGFRIALLCALGTLAAVGMAWRRLRTADAMLLLMFLALAVSAMRFMTYFGIISAYVLAGLAPLEWRRLQFQRQLYQCSMVAAAAVLVTAATVGNAQHNKPYANDGDSKFSPRMVASLSDPAMKGNVLNSAELGAELVFLAWPRLRPSIDSRIDSYGAAYFEAHQDLLRDKPRLTAFLKQYDVQYMLFSRDDLEAAKASLGEQLLLEWDVRLLDRKAVLFARRQPGGSGSQAVGGSGG
ncbi:MAG: hypothetical protein EOO28_25610 [Comamonadaceae bacterium]|nr:MAG: hypothetical protein EOO28_25610 [Comamonadaceae bacterium]